MMNRNTYEKRIALRKAPDDWNLAEFPFTLLNRATKGKGKQRNIECHDTVRLPNKQVLERKWRVSGSLQWGLPEPIDEEVFVALAELTKEQGFADRLVVFTPYQLFRKMGWSTGGASYERLEAALGRLHGATIEAENAFWDHDQMKYVTVFGFHIVEKYGLHRRSKPKAESEPEEGLAFIVWGEEIFKSLKAGSLVVDPAFYFSLRRPLSKRLYRHLNKRFHDRKTSYSIELARLGVNHLGFSPNRHPTHIKRDLTPANEELLETGFLKGFEYHRRKRGEWVVTYYPGRLAAKQTRPQSSISEQSSEFERHRELVEKLAVHGVTEKVASQLVSQFPLEVIERQLEYLPYRNANDPAAVLVKAVRENWAPPAEYERKYEEQKRKERLRAEAEARRVERAAEEEVARQVAEVKAKLPPEELDSLRQEALSSLPPSVQQLVVEKLEQGGQSGFLEAAVDRLIKERWASNGGRR